MFIEDDCFMGKTIKTNGMNITQKKKLIARISE